MENLNDYLRAVRRQNTWILGPALAGIVLGVVIAFLWPDTYVSQAVIRVIHAPLSEKIAPPVLNAQLNDRMAQLANDVMSRASLSAMIETRGLYLADRRRLPMEDVVEAMRRDIKLAPVGFLPSNVGDTQARLSAFRMTFEYPDRIAAQRVCHDLTSNFISASVRWRTEEGGAVNDMFKLDAERQRGRVAELDRQIEAFRSARATLLPEHRQTHLTRAGVLEGRLSDMRRQASRAASELATEEGRLAELMREKEGGQPGTSPAVTSATDPVVNAAELQLESLRRRYRDTHPDVITARDLLAAARAQQSRRPPAAADPAAGREVRERDAQIAGVRNAIAVRRTEVAGLGRELAALDGEIRAAEARAGASSAGETEYEQLRRDRQRAQEQLDEAERKAALTEQDQRLRVRGHGERLELGDPASLPQIPTEPNRAMLSFSGFGLGLTLGLLIATWRVLRDTSLKDVQDVEAHTGLALLACVPLLENDLVVRRRRRLQWLAWSTACLAGVFLMAGSVAYYYVQHG